MPLNILELSFTKLVPICVKRSFVLQAKCSKFSLAALKLDTFKIQDSIQDFFQNLLR